MGSDDVVKAFNSLMQYVFKMETIPENEKDPKELLNFWGQFLLEIRKSVGDKKTKLNVVDMLRNQITDIDKF